MIASTVPGRIRVRTPLLKSSQFSKEVSQKVQNLTGFDKVRTNLKSGSLIVTYHPEQVDEQHIELEVEELCFKSPPPRKKKNPVSAKVGQVSKIGMIATLIPSIALGFAGKKKLHIYTGVAFLAFAGLHTTRFSKTLFN